MVEQWSHNPSVGGSIPSTATKKGVFMGVKSFFTKAAKVTQFIPGMPRLPYLNKISKFSKLEQRIEVLNIQVTTGIDMIYRKLKNIDERIDRIEKALDIECGGLSGISYESNKNGKQ